MAYRASTQASTKYAPYYLVFQQDMRLPIDAEIMPAMHNHYDDSSADSPDEGSDETVQQLLLAKRKEVFGTVEKNLQDAQAKQKEVYDKKHKPEEIAVGSEVLIENTLQKGRKGGNLDDAFKGSYFIEDNMGKGLYKVRNQTGTVLKKKVNINRLKLHKRRGLVKAAPPAKEPISYQPHILSSGELIYHVHMNPMYLFHIIIV